MLPSSQLVSSQYVSFIQLDKVTASPYGYLFLDVGFVRNTVASILLPVWRCLDLSGFCSVSHSQVVSQTCVTNCARGSRHLELCLDSSALLSFFPLWIATRPA